MLKKRKRFPERAFLKDRSLSVWQRSCHLGLWICSLNHVQTLFAKLILFFCTSSFESPIRHIKSLTGGDLICNISPFPAPCAYIWEIPVNIFKFTVFSFLPLSLNLLLVNLVKFLFQILWFSSPEVAFGFSLFFFSFLRPPPPRSPPPTAFFFLSNLIFSIFFSLGSCPLKPWMYL